MDIPFLWITFFCVGEVGRLVAELERLHRLELELRRQLKDRDRVIDDVQQESEKRIGQIQVFLTRIGLISVRCSQFRNLENLAVEA